MRDRAADYESAGAVVLGVSSDAPARLRAFAEKHRLGFKLLSDPDHVAANAYGVWVEKSMYGRKFFGNERTTFLIGPGGKVEQVFRKVKPAQHDDRVLGALGRSPAAT